MNEEVIIRQYKPGDENGIICLLETVFDGWPHKDLQCTPLDHWRWKYEDNPLKSNAVAVAECAGKIVGCTHGLFMNVKIGKKVQLAQQGMDLAVDEDLRGRGMHPKITDLKRKIMIEKNINITFSTSGNPLVIRHDRDRPQFPSPLMQMIKIRDVDQHLKMVDYSNKLTKKYGYLGLRTLKRVKNRLTTTQSPTSNLEISEIERFDEQIDGFWGEIEDNYSFIIKRDMNYLNWRYCDKRGGEFKIMQATAGDKILGYMALRINRYRKEYPVGIIAGLLTLPGRPEVARCLDLLC